MALFPINLSNRTASFWTELADFNDEGFDIIVPGLSIELDRFVTPDGIITKSEEFSIERNIDMGYKLHDYNIQFIASGQDDNVIFSSNQPKHIIKLDKQTVKSNILSKLWTISDHITELPNVPLSKIKIFLGDNCEEFLSNLFSNRELSHKIWNDKLAHCERRGYEIAQKIKDDLWNQNRIKQIYNPRDWYGPNYQSFQVGLKHDRFIEFYQCAIQYDIPKDIFKILCEYWFQAEVSDAKQRLSLYSN
jgi:hypothetical protein